MSAATQRLLTVLNLLQSHRSMSGPDMAQRLGVDVRTVRRIIRALQDMGIPVEAERGCYGAYRLDQGFKLPPLMFDEDEIVAITLGLMTISAMRFPVAAADIASALAKIGRSIPEHLAEYLRGVQSVVCLHPVAAAAAPGVSHDVLSVAGVAALRGLGTELQDATGTRRYDPYSIVFTEGRWYLVGYCHGVQDVVTLPADRITALALLDVSFAKPTDFDALHWALRDIQRAAAHQA